MSGPPASRVLGVDVTTRGAGVALVSAGRLLAERPLSAGASPSGQLMPLIRDILAVAGLEPCQLTGLAVTVGPGSFTGTRVGLATLQALSHAAGIPLAGVSTLEALLESSGAPPPALAAWLDAGKGEVYARFRSSSRSSGGAQGQAPGGAEEERLTRPEDLLRTLPARAIRFSGSGALLHAGLIRSRPGRQAGDEILAGPLLLAAATAHLGARALLQGRPGVARPHYMRPAAATIGR